LVEWALNKAAIHMVEREKELAVLRTSKGFREWSAKHVFPGATVGLLSTKGSIHDGHLALLTSAREICHVVVVTISIVPTQFPTREDFTAFPRQITQDLETLRDYADAVITLSGEEVCRYGLEHGAKVHLESDLIPRQYSDLPVEQGECTMLCKMLNIVQPTHLFIGQRSLVRARMLQRLLEDLLYSVEVVAIPTIRDEYNIAYDARLSLLSAGELVAVRIIYKALNVMVTSYLNGNFDAANLIERGRQSLQTEPAIDINFVRIAHPFGFHDIGLIDPAIGAVAAVNVTIAGRITLHDNVILAKQIPAHEQTLWGLVKSVTQQEANDQPRIQQHNDEN
jgi:pantoate--beta-alanine ligase